MSLPSTLTPSNVALIADTELAKLPQATASVIHRFGPGIYIREVSIPAGTFAVGHLQKTEHLNVLLKGRVEMSNGDGTTTEVVAPFMYAAPPGRKVGLVKEDMVWLNIYATTECDVDKLEAMFIDKSQAFQATQSDIMEQERQRRQNDRDDYEKVLAECGITAETARSQSENTDDQINVENYRIRILDSPIEGRGVFLTSPAQPGEVLAQARIMGKRTNVGRFTNHSPIPNAAMVKRENGDIDLVAIKSIDGCRGGDNGQEVTIDYRRALALSGAKS